jgi:hypothetical protein
MLERTEEPFPKRVAALLVIVGGRSRLLPDCLSKAGRDFIRALLVARNHPRAWIVWARERVERGRRHPRKTAGRIT